MTDEPNLLGAFLRARRELTLHREKLQVSGVDGVMLVIYHPDAGSADESKLAVLGALAAV